MYWQVEMRNMETGDLAVFHVDAWLSKTKEDRQLSRDVPATVRGKSAVKREPRSTTLSHTLLCLCEGAVRRSIELANFCGRGLVAKDNRPMKSLNRDTRHLSCHDSDDKKWQTMRTPTLLCCFVF